MFAFHEKYKALNDSFVKTLVFKVGANSGFYSEINNMIFAMLYCLDNKIKFKITSLDANFANTKGWQEYFLPFCEEDDTEFHIKHNHRFIYEENMAEVEANKDVVEAYKQKSSIDFLTYDIFTNFYNNYDFANKKFVIKELEMEGLDSFQASKNLAKMVYNFNDETKNLINAKIDRLKLPEQYVAMHIRGGDISQEVEFRKQRLLNVDAYIEKIEFLSKDIKNIFVFTDDYRHVVEMKKKRPAWRINTLCEVSENGFVCVDFLAQPWSVKKDGHIKLFANIEICRNAIFFVGTYVSNPDWFLNLVMEDNFYCVDCDKIEWQVIRDKNNILSQYPNEPKKTKKIDRLKRLMKTVLPW